VRELLSFVLLACACGVSANAPPAGAGAETPGANGGAGAAGDAQARASSAEIDALAARGAEVAPGMREVARRESTVEKTEIAHADGHDACLRVAFSAAAPVAVKLVDQRGGVLGGVDATAQGVIGERGPVCVRSGDAVFAVVSPAGTTVSFVAWAAP
jgi:hypothetical protein